MQATNLKTNHLSAPLGMDAGTLFLSWQCAEGVRQTAYEIEVTAGAETLWASGKVLGSAMHTETPTAVPPKTQGQWRIRLWDENDQPGAWSTASFETGLAQSDWQGVWVCPETEKLEIDCTDAINAFSFCLRAGHCGGAPDGRRRRCGHLCRHPAALAPGIGRKNCGSMIYCFYQ